MKVLLYSPAFLPGIGGLELAVAQLADGLSGAGHEVTVVTTTPGTGPPGASYGVVRCPGARELLRLTRWCDVFFQANVSLKGLWPLLLVRRPWVVNHHSWYRRPDGNLAWQDRLKRRLLRHASASIAVSRAMAADVGAPLVIPNTYRSNLFRRMAGIDRDGALLFVGRLVSDKGCDVLLEALAILSRRGLLLPLTVVGQGPERAALERAAEMLGVRKQVTFLGQRLDDELACLMNRHRILVVPSRYEEPFGIVALEGIACGCRVIGSMGGGLPESIGACGSTFRNGDAAALAQRIEEALSQPEIPADVSSQHLAAHSTGEVLAQYLAVLKDVCPPRDSGAEVAT